MNASESMSVLRIAHFECTLNLVHCFSQLGDCALYFIKFVIIKMLRFYVLIDCIS